MDQVQSIQVPVLDYEKLTAPFDKSDHKTRAGAGNQQFTYIEGYVYINRLNEFGGTWHLTMKEWFKEGDAFYVVAALTIEGLGTRDGMGVQKIVDRAGEDLLKGALTDALKNAAKYFGMGIELYEDKKPATAQGYSPRVVVAPRLQRSRAEESTE